MLSENSSKIGASVMNGRDRSACRFSAMKIDTEQTLKNRNQEGKSPNLNVNRFAMPNDNNIQIDNFAQGLDGDNHEANHADQYSNVRKNLRNFPMYSAGSDDKAFNKSSESMKSSVNAAQQRPNNISNFISNQ